MVGLVADPYFNPNGPVTQGSAPTPAVPPITPPGPAAPLPYGTTSVEERVNSIASKDSSLNQMARTEAIKAMGRRGMVNSALTVGAAQDAVIKNALPIASQDASQAFTGEENRLSRDAAMKAQEKELGFRSTEAEKDRAWNSKESALSRVLQERLASWQFKSSDRNAAAQLLTNMESMYQSAYQTIMNNTNLNATQRTQQLTAAKQMRDRQINFVEQMYNVDLKW